MIRNFRVPRADLESVYGAGPMGSPHLYRRDPAKLLLSPSGCDVPRNHEGIALIGDPRNETHLFMSQMTVLHHHHRTGSVDRLRDFDEARRAATWHYQHVILREFLPGLIGAGLTGELVDGGPQLYGGDRIRSSSPTPPTGTVTRRSATATRSTGASAPARCSPT